MTESMKAIMSVIKTNACGLSDAQTSEEVEEYIKALDSLGYRLHDLAHPEKSPCLPMMERPSDDVTF